MVYETAISIGMVFSGFAMIYLSAGLSDDHRVMSLLFMLLGMFTITVNMDFLSKIATTNSQTAIASILVRIYQGYLVVTLFTIAYFTIMFLKVLFMQLAGKKHKTGDYTSGN